MESVPSHEATLFLHLLLGLQHAAMVSLGKLKNPMSDKIERNLEAAKNTIDTLAAIESRTRGNLDPDEQRVLAQVLAELRMNYVDEVKKGA